MIYTNYMYVTSYWFHKQAKLIMGAVGVARGDRRDGSADCLGRARREISGATPCSGSRKGTGVCICQ